MDVEQLRQARRSTSARRKRPDRRHPAGSLRILKIAPPASLWLLGARPWRVSASSYIVRNLKAGRTACRRDRAGSSGRRSGPRERETGSAARWRSGQGDMKSRIASAIRMSNERFDRGSRSPRRRAAFSLEQRQASGRARTRPGPSGSPSSTAPTRHPARHCGGSGRPGRTACAWPGKSGSAISTSSTECSSKRSSSVSSGPEVLEARSPGAESAITNPIGTICAEPASRVGRRPRCASRNRPAPRARW